MFFIFRRNGVEVSTLEIPEELVKQYIDIFRDITICVDGQKLGKYVDPVVFDAKEQYFEVNTFDEEL